MRDQKPHESPCTNSRNESVSACALMDGTPKFLLSELVTPFECGGSAAQHNALSHEGGGRSLCMLLALPPLPIGCPRHRNAEDTLGIDNWCPCTDPFCSKKRGQKNGHFALKLHPNFGNRFLKGTGRLFGKPPFCPNECWAPPLCFCQSLSCYTRRNSDHRFQVRFGMSGRHTNRQTVQDLQNTLCQQKPPTDRTKCGWIQTMLSAQHQLSFFLFTHSRRGGGGECQEGKGRRAATYTSSPQANPHPPLTHIVLGVLGVGSRGLPCRE